MLGPHDPFRKIGFLVALAMIMGAAVVDLRSSGREAVAALRAPGRPRSGRGPAGAASAERGLVAWVVGWGVALVLVATLLLRQPVAFVLFALALAFVFVFINGIRTASRTRTRSPAPSSSRCC